MRDRGQDSGAGVAASRRWRQLVEGLDAITWEADAERLRVTSVSPRAQELLGYPLERWLTGDELRARRDQVSERREHRSDFRLPSAEGKSLWFHEVVSLRPGEPEVLEGAMIDVTALRDASRAHETGDPGVSVRVGGEIIDRVDAPVIATDLEGAITYWNQHAEHTYGYPRDAAVEQQLHQLLIAPPDRDRAAAAIAQASVAGGWEGELEARHRDGTSLARWVKAAPLREETGQLAGVVWICVDAAASPKTHRALAVSEAVKDGILQSALDCIVTMDPAGRVVDFNPAAERTFGYSREEAVGRDLADLIIPEALRPAHKAGLARHMATGRSAILDRRLELTGLRADGTEFPVELTVTRIDADGAMVFAGYLRDLTDLRRTEERMVHLATRDQLTGLPNRLLLHDHLELAAARVKETGGALALLHLDLNRFKLVNESLGRAGGDEVLRRMAERLDGLRQVQIVAREGGDEFLLLAEPSLHSTGGAGDLGPNTARAIAATVADAVQQPLLACEQELALGSHVGVSLLPGDADTPEALLAHAETALRDGQRARRPVHLYDQRDAGNGSGGGLSFISDLRGAVTRNEFELHYQPIVELDGGAIVGAEALIRWRHPKRGMIAPSEFIPLLEDSGLMHDAGKWVVGEAFSQLSDWAKARPGFQMALNLSLAELGADDIAKRLADGAERRGIDPATVSIEITETVAMIDPGQMVPVFEELAGAGFPLAIDDFGTGHSSLARLWRLPVSRLKIDRSFTDAMTGDVGAAAMVGTIIRLAEGLNVSTVAEGIETEEQLGLLLDMGCRLGQGFLFSRPLPAPEFTAHAFS